MTDLPACRMKSGLMTSASLSRSLPSVPFVNTSFSFGFIRLGSSSSSGSWLAVYTLGTMVKVMVSLTCAVSRLALSGLASDDCSARYASGRTTNAVTASSGSSSHGTSLAVFATSTR